MSELACYYLQAEKGVWLVDLRHQKVQIGARQSNLQVGFHCKRHYKLTPWISTTQGTYRYLCTGTELLQSLYGFQAWHRKSINAVARLSVTSHECLSRIRIFPSRIQGQKDTGSRFRIRPSNFKYFYSSKFYNALRNMVRDVFSGSQIWIFSIPDPGVNKAPDPGSGSETLPSSG